MVATQAPIADASPDNDRAILPSALFAGLSITPSVLMLKDQAPNPEDDIIWVWGMRFRMMSANFEK